MIKEVTEKGRPWNGPQKAQFWCGKAQMRRGMGPLQKTCFFLRVKYLQILQNTYMLQDFFHTLS